MDAGEKSVERVLDKIACCIDWGEGESGEAFENLHCDTHFSDRFSVTEAGECQRQQRRLQERLRSSGEHADTCAPWAR
ncbi:hypothetical protein D3C80_1866220 [compost metagenome]